MLSGITSGALQSYAQASSQSAPIAQNTVQTAAAQTQNSQPQQDSIQLSVSALNALETPDGLFKAAAAGNNEAIAIITEDLSPIPHLLDLTA
jgi:hypothetical protein